MNSLALPKQRRALRESSSRDGKSSSDSSSLLRKARLPPRLTDYNDFSLGWAFPRTISSHCRISMCLSLTSRMGMSGHRSDCVLAAAGVK
jgi:hypothetical protein